MNLSKNIFVKSLKVLVSPFFFIYGYIFFCFTKKTNNLIYQSYVKTYCLSSGFINEIVTFFIQFLSKSRKKNIINDKKTIDINNELKNNGYVVLKNKLENKLLNGLIDVTKDLGCNNNKLNKNFTKEVFDKEIHNLSTYYYSENELLKNSAVQDTIKFLQELCIADEYFKSKPYLIATNMWWSTIGDKVDSFAAQDFHFDLDGIKWLKYFIYLTDVTTNNGPHVYVEGTHKPFSKPYDILMRGYSRVSDREIEKNYPLKKIKTITGDKGTIIIGDTSCFHKGMVPKSDVRLIFEVTFANSYFGTSLVNKYKIDQSN